MTGAEFELYQDNAGEWRWRLVHANGNIIADSGQGYASAAGARDGIASVKANVEAEVVEVDDPLEPLEPLHEDDDG